MENMRKSADGEIYGCGANERSDVMKKLLESEQPTRREAMRLTEDRLKAYPIIKDRLADNEEELAELNEGGTQALKRSANSIVRTSPTGLRLSDDELLDVRKSELRLRVFFDRREVRRVERALELIAEDPYATVIKSFYFGRLKDSIIAQRLCCDRATVYRNRKRLVEIMAHRLYGAFAQGWE